MKCAVLAVLTWMEPKLSAVGLRLTAGAATAVPVSGTRSWPPETLAATDRVAVRVPATVGAKTMLAVQVTLVARVTPMQVLLLTR